VGARSFAHADEPPSRPDTPADDALELELASWRTDALITGAGALAYFLSESVFKTTLVPETCRWCEPPRVDRSIRKHLVWDDPAKADQISDFLGFGATPLVSLGLLGVVASHDDRWNEWPIDALVAVEALVIASDLNQAVKMMVGRERPFVHQLDPADKGDTEHPEDNNLSFYSGHTSFVFSIATAAGTIASQRRRRWAPAVWGGGLALAATTSYLRIGADKHWASDVAIGAIVGGAIGVAVPRLRLRRARILPSPGGIAIAGSF
jgi:membrane-associated phospholipid phosphatase